MFSMLTTNVSIIIFVITLIITFSGCDTSQGNTFVREDNHQVGNKQLIESSNKVDCSINFENFTFPSPLTFEEKTNEKIALKDGKLESEEIGFGLASVSYSDLIGDEKKEAIVTLGIRTGGSSQPNAIYVFDTSQPQPKVLWTLYQVTERKKG